MDSVYILWHTHGTGVDDLLIGVYATRKDAEAAVLRVRDKPGFCDAPTLIEPSASSDDGGFVIDEYRVGEDHWTEGFVTVYWDEEGNEEGAAPPPA